MDELAGLLSRERRLLEVLLFKLVSARHLLAAGEARFLAWAAQEVERASERVRELELLRAALVHKLARSAGLAEDQLSLKALAEESPEPYRTLFEDHRQAFFELVAEIEEVTRANRELAHRGVTEVTAALDKVDMRNRPESEVRLYGPAAAIERVAVGPAHFDGII